MTREKKNKVKKVTSQERQLQVFFKVDSYMKALAKTSKQKTQWFALSSSIVRQMSLKDANTKAWRQILWDLEHGWENISLKSEDDKFDVAFLFLDAVSYLIYHGHSYDRMRRTAFQINVKRKRWACDCFEYFVALSRIFSYKKKIEQGDYFFSPAIEDAAIMGIEESGYDCKYPLHPEILLREMERLLHAKEEGEPFEARHKQLAPYFETEIEDFVFIVPTYYSDIKKEATIQRNCTALRYKQYLDGQYIYVYMRKKDKPDVPYVTIVVDEEKGNIVWAITKNHQDVKGEDERIVNDYVSWYREKGFFRKKKRV